FRCSGCNEAVYRPRFHATETRFVVPNSIFCCQLWKLISVYIGSPPSRLKSELRAVPESSTASLLLKCPMSRFFNPAQPESIFVLSTRSISCSEPIVSLLVFRHAIHRKNGHGLAAPCCQAGSHRRAALTAILRIAISISLLDILRQRRNWCIHLGCR